jgi:hypothetical protein
MLIRCSGNVFTDKLLETGCITPLFIRLLRSNGCTRYNINSVSYISFFSAISLMQGWQWGKMPRLFFPSGSHAMNSCKAGYITDQDSHKFEFNDGLSEILRYRSNKILFRSADALYV